MKMKIILSRLFIIIAEIMFYSDLMLRIGSTKAIEQQYENCCLKFGCPANCRGVKGQVPDSDQIMLLA